MIGYRSLLKSYMDITIGKKTRTRIIERPGRWMSDAQLDSLMSDIRQVSAAAGYAHLSYGALEGSRTRLEKSIFTVIYEGKKPIAFNSMTFMTCALNGRSTDVIHLGLVVIDPGVRAKGLSWILYGLTSFLLFFRNRMRPLWISNVTQVPAILGSCAEAFTGTYPNPQNPIRRTFEQLLLAREIMSDHRAVFGVGAEAEFDEDAFIIRNAYTGGSDSLKKTFDQAPKHRAAVFNDFCLQNLNYERGDDFLQIGQFDFLTFYRYLAHSAPKNVVVMLLFRGIFSLTEKMFVPVINWFSPSKQMGELRPWR